MSEISLWSALLKRSKRSHTQEMLSLNRARNTRKELLKGNCGQSTFSDRRRRFDRSHLAEAIDPDEINKISPIAEEEAFGTTACLYEAIARANRTSYGLSAPVFTGEYGRGLRMARELEFGQV